MKYPPFDHAEVIVKPRLAGGVGALRLLPMERSGIADAG
jgi:hypothetical protein